MPLLGARRDLAAALVCGGAALLAVVVWYALRRQEPPRRRRRFRVTDARGCAIRVRTAPDVDAPKASDALRAGEIFEVAEVVETAGCQRYLRLEDGRGWVFTHSARDGRLLVEECPEEGLAAAVKVATPGAAAALVSALRRSAGAAKDAGDVAAMAVALDDVLAAVAGNRHVALLCRQAGAISTVAEAWRVAVDVADAAALGAVAASAAAALSSYVAVHADVLRRQGVAGLCAGTLRVVASPAVARLWTKMGGPSAQELVATMGGAEDLDVETARWLLRGALRGGDLEVLRAASARELLERLLFGPLCEEAMALLCASAEPIAVLAEDAAEAESEGSESLAGDDLDAPPTVAAAPAAEPQGASLSAACRAGDAAARAAGVEALLEASSPEDAEPLSEASAEGVWLDRSPRERAESDEAAERQAFRARSRAEFLEHMRVDAADAAAWPEAFPELTASERCGLRFSAAFEGANLQRVRLDSSGGLEVVVRGDTGAASRHRQWFAFDVAAEAPRTVRLRIVSVSKPTTTFTEGQRVVLRQGRGSWRRSGEDYAFFPNRYAIGGQAQRHTLALSLPLDAGVTRVALFYPYLPGDLLADLRRLRPAGDCLEVRDVGPTPGGRRLPMLVITDFSSPARRPHVVISARVHPGEAPASYMMRGVLQVLLSRAEASRALRRDFVFVVFPMLNPDGVAAGNVRCNLAGRDLNRCWEHPPAASEVEAVKAELSALHAGGCEMLALVDLHAHSRRHGAFTLSNPGCVALPDLLAGAGGALFDRGGCTFGAPRAKRGSARCVAWRELGVAHAHTVEATYARYPRRGREVEPRDLEEFGRRLALALPALRPEPEAAPEAEAAPSLRQRRRAKRGSAAAACGP